MPVLDHDANELPGPLVGTFATYLSAATHRVRRSVATRRLHFTKRGGLIRVDPSGIN